MYCRKVDWLAVGVIAAIVIGIIVSLFSGEKNRSYEDAVEQFIEAIFDADVEAIVELIPEEVLECVLEENGYTKKEFIREGNEAIQEMFGDVSGKDMEISYEISCIENCYGEYLEYLQEDYYNENVDVEIESAKDIEVEVTIEAAGEKWEEWLYIPLIQVDGSWYLDISNF